MALGPSLGRGGEGQVFTAGDGSSLAVKLYHRPDDMQRRKVQAMIAARLHQRCPMAACPMAVATDEAGRFLGFAMPAVVACQPLHQLYSPVSRLRHFPNADFRFLVRAAANVARAVAAIHAAGPVFGDLNHSGILVSALATATVIDVDSFQFAGFRCRVGIEEYTAPELRDADFSAVDRTVDHDGFGLAVLLFQILGLGRHPHAGVHGRRDAGLGQAIAAGRFAYSLVRKTGVQPPPGTVSLADLPLGLRVAFERAFGMVAGARPTARAWVRELDDLERGLTPCAVNGRHRFHPTAGRCPWCRIEGDRPGWLFGKGETVRIDAGKIDPVLRSRVREAIAAGKAMRHPAPLVDLVRFINRQPSGVDGGRGPSVAGGASVQSAAAQRSSSEIAEVEELVGRLERVRAALDGHPSFLVTARVDAMATARAADVAESLRARTIGECKVRGLGFGRQKLLFRAGILTAQDLSREVLDGIRGIDASVAAELLVWRDEVASSADRPDAVVRRVRVVDVVVRKLDTKRRRGLEHELATTLFRCETLLGGGVRFI